MRTRINIVLLLFLALSSSVLLGQSANLTESISNESDIRDNSNTLTVTLSGDKFLGDIATSDGAATTFLAGFSGGSSAWDALIGGLTSSDISLNADSTIATINIGPSPSYFIPVTESVTFTIPAASLKSGGPAIAATGSVSVLNEDPVISINTQTYVETDIRASSINFDITLLKDEWATSLTSTFKDSIDSNGAVWDAEIRPNLTVSRISNSIVRVTIPQTPGFNIDTDEDVTIKVAASNLQHTNTGVFDVSGQKNIDAAPVSVTASATFNGLNEGNIRSGSYTIELVLHEDTWSANIGGDNATNNSLIEGLSFNNGQSANSMENAIEGSDRGAANTSVNSNIVTIVVPAIPAFDITSDVNVSITVPSVAMVNTVTSISANNFASIDRIDPSITIETNPLSPINSTDLDGAKLNVTLAEATWNSTFSSGNFDFNWNPAQTAVLSADAFNLLNPNLLEITLGFTGTLTGNASFTLTVDDAELTGASSPVSSPAPGISVIAIVDPVITGVSIPNQGMGIGETVTATLTVEDDRGQVFSLVGGTIAGRSVYDLSGVGTSYTVKFDIGPAGSNPQYAPDANILYTNLQLRNGSLIGNQYSGSIIQGSDTLDTERPVVDLISINDGTYAIGDPVSVIVHGQETGLRFNPSSTTINGVPLSSGNVSYLENGSGIYLFTYIVGTNDPDVSGSIPVNIVAKDRVGNESNPFNTVTGAPSIVDGHAPVISSVDEISAGVKTPGDDIQLLVSSTETGLKMGAGTMVNGVLIQATDFLDNLNNTYTITYTVGPNDNEVSSGNLTATVVLEDDAGNSTSQVNGLLNRDVSVFTRQTLAVISGSTAVCAGESATVFVNCNGGVGPFDYEILETPGGILQFNDQAASQELVFTPSTTTTYTLISVQDNLGIDGNTGGSATITVHSLPVVSITSPPNGTTEISIGTPIDLVGDPAGGVFSGRGVEGTSSKFYPDIAGLGADTIYYTYTNPSTGCSNSDSIIFNVVEEQLIINDLPPVICYNQPIVNISATNSVVPGDFGFFNLYDSRDIKRATPLPGILDAGNNTAQIFPEAIPPGSYVVRFTYLYEIIIPLFGSFSYTYITEESFSLDYIDPIKLLRVPEPVVCKNHLPSSLVANLDNPLEDYSFSGPGVTGDPVGGFDFIPGAAALGPGEIKYLYVTDKGCRDSVYYDIEVFDVPNVSFSPDKTCMPFEGGIINFANETDKTDLVTNWTWNFGDIESGFANIHESTSFEPVVMHKYTAAGSHIVSLEVKTSAGCMVDYEDPLDFGDEPVADFRWKSDCFIAGEPLELVNESLSKSGRDFEPFTWNIYNEDASLLETFSTENVVEDPLYQFSSSGKYFVELIAENDVGCIDTKYDTLKFKTTVDFNGADGHYMDFNANDEYWSSISRFNDSASAWTWGAPQFEGFEAEPGDYAWYTRLKEDVKEKSWIQSQCFDFRELERPMIRMDVLKSFDFNRDGAVVQYTLDNGVTWQTIGNIGEGINWYNSFTIKELPGGGKSGAGSPIGWSGGEVFDPDTSWVNVAHDIDELAGESLVIFGIFYATDGASVVDNRGFAVDNVYVGERTKVALIEHFTNAGDQNSTDADEDINTFTDNNSLDVTSLQYHMPYPGDDPMNEDYPAPAASRSFYYGVNDVPYAIMDGGITSSYNFDFSPSIPSAQQLKKLTLESPLFDIDLKLFFGQTAGRLSADVEMVALEDISMMDLVLNVAVLEKVHSYNGAGASEFRNVVIAMLPNAAGTVYSRAWALSDHQKEIFHYYAADLFDPDNLKVVAFLQDRNSGKVLQVAEAENPEFPLTSGASKTEPLRIYPNPAKDIIYVDKNLSAETSGLIEICDMTGRIVALEEIHTGDQHIAVNIQSLPEGSYILNWKEEGRIKARSGFVKIR